MGLFHRGNKALLITIACVAVIFLALVWTIQAALRPTQEYPPNTPAPTDRSPVSGATVVSTDGKYAVTDLGALENTDNVEAFAVNDLGRVVGESGQRPFVWFYGGMFELMGIKDTSLWSGLSGPRLQNAAAQAINQKGEIGGWIAIWPDVESPGVPSRFDVCDAFVFRDHDMIDGRVGGADSEVYALNDRDEMAGQANLTGASHHAVFWNKSGHAKDLGALVGGVWGTGDSCALGMNDKGDVVGVSGTHAFDWNGKKMRDLGPGQANAINDNGVIAGQSQGRACVWRNGRRSFLPAPRKLPSMALGINRSGEVVGEAGGDAALWSNGRWVDLDRRAWFQSAWHLTRAYGINNRGEIVGVGRLHGPMSGFLLARAWKGE